MPDQKTAPMDDGKWPPRKRSDDEQATLHAGQDDATPPAMPAVRPGDRQQVDAGAPTVAADTPGRWQPGGGGADEQATEFGGEQARVPPAPPPGSTPGGFVRTRPADTPTPEPFWQRPPQAPGQQAAPPFGAPPQEQAQQPDQHTMLIGQEDAKRVRPEMAWFAVFDGPDQDSIGRIHRLKPDHTSIGRHPGNDVVVIDSFCSALHARVRAEPNPDDGEPQFVLYDVGSANGTFIGSRQTYRDPESKSYRHVLQDGDFVLLGETTLVFKKV